MRNITWPAMVLAAVTSTVSAAISTDFVLIGRPQMEGVTYNIYEMRVTTDTDWTNSRLDLTLSAGRIGQHSLGGYAPPSPSLVTLAPDVAYDSYVRGSSGNLSGTAGEVVMTDRRIGISWYDTADSGPGTHTLARIALSRDAVGQAAGKTYDIETAGVGVPFLFEFSGAAGLDEDAWADSGGPYAILPGRSITLEAGVSGAVSGHKIAGYRWRLGGLSLPSASSFSLDYRTLSNAGLEAGIHELRLILTDDEGLSTEHLTTLEIIPEPAAMSLLLSGCLAGLVCGRRRKPNCSSTGPERR